MTIALEKIKSLASSHPINSSTFDLGMFVLEVTNLNLYLNITIIIVYFRIHYDHVGILEL